MKRFKKTVEKRSTADLRFSLAMAITVAFVIMAIPTGEIAGQEGAAGKTFQSTPMNSDLVAFVQNPPEEFYGDIPPTFDLSHVDQIPVARLRDGQPFPSRFDWRDFGKVSAVKNQNPCGTCWAFAASSALESSALMTEALEYDFSEQSVCLCVDRSWVYLYDDVTDPCMPGGNCWLGAEVFIRKGSVEETCNPYNAAALNCNGTCACDSCPPVKTVDAFRLVAWDGSEIDTIKEAIYYNGPAKLSYAHDSESEYWDDTWGAIYDHYPCTGDTNHAVTVVGWDDEVPHPDPDHTGTGAWIIKNSWGTSDPWAGGPNVSNGYFYLAYDSSCIQRIIHLDYKDHVPDEELLYWDEGGWVTNVGGGADYAWVASVFTSSQASDLTHVEFWTTSNNAAYEIYVLDSYFGPELANQGGTCQETGYYSIQLNTPISLAAAQQFTVTAKITTPGYNYPIAVEEISLGVVEPAIQSNVSFIRVDDVDPWDDTSNYDWNGCLRARLLAPGEVEVPDVVGMTQGNAEAAIVAAQLTVGNVTEEFSCTVPAGDVISQDPVAGTCVDPGTAVDLVVSLGPLEVPDVVGMSQADAEAAIIAAGLTVGNVTEEYSCTVPAGDVISQDPVAGTCVDPNSPVNIVVSLGPPSKIICAALGDDPLGYRPDINIFRFQGTKGATVTIRLEADPPGSALGRTVHFAFSPLFQQRRVVTLPHEITWVLRSSGYHYVSVGAPLRKEAAKVVAWQQYLGDYCITLEACPQISQTFEPARYVE